MSQLTNDQVQFIQSILNKHGSLVRRKHVVSFAEENGLPVPRLLLKSLKSYKSKYGVYDLTAVLQNYGVQLPIQEKKGRGRPKGSKNKKPTETIQTSQQLLPSSTESISVVNDTSQDFVGNHDVYVPVSDPLFIPFGNFKDIKNIIKSRIFYPVYITGLSGNGKTTMVEQICSSVGREMIRVNITHETDEDMLLGGFRLVEGNTVWFDGPVIKAMKAGAILLLDEVDLNAIKILCLQPILEGKGVLLKRINQYVKPAPGFNVIATANTKGKGSEDGKFVGTNVMNETFLERFAVTFEQEYPEQSIEKKILNILFEYHNIKDEEFSDILVQWAGSVRQLYKNGGTDEIISTRRLVHIARAYAIFGDKQKAVELCISRFDENTKVSFLDMFSKFLRPTDPEVKFEESIDSKDSLDWSNLPELEPIS